MARLGISAKERQEAQLTEVNRCGGQGKRQILFRTDDVPQAAKPGKASLDMTTLRERQAPLKAQYETDPESAKLVMTVRSATSGDDPTRCTVAAIGMPDSNGVTWEAGAHPMAGGDGDLACSGDLLLASLAACQEITLRMVAAAMGIELRNVEVTVEGDLDFRGTMGIDAETPVGFQGIRTSVRFDADAAPDRLQRLAARAERYCVVGATLREGTTLATDIAPRDAGGETGDE
jgi:uncharacterized OsmC-like protein